MDGYHYMKYLLQILHCAVEDSVPELSLGKQDWGMLRILARYHKVDAMLYPALKKIREQIDNEIFEKIKEDYDLATVIFMNQEYYLKQISRILNDEGIWYMPLKGSVLRYLYPYPEMRQSADIDILFDCEYADKVKKLLCGIGFVNKKFGSDQDVYIIEPYVCVEMHRSLLPERSKQYEFVKEIVERKVCVDNSFEYRMSNEDFYIFHIIHAAKHMSEGGIGIRAFLDLWILLNRFGDSMDRDIIDKRLDEANLKLFEENIRKLTSYWFNNGEKNEYTDEIEAYVFNSGWTGTYKQKTALMSEDYVNENKIMYYFKYIFKSIDELKIAYKYLTKYPILLPIAWGDRIFKALFKRKGAINEFVHRYDGIDENDIKRLKDFAARIGL